MFERQERELPPLLGDPSLPEDERVLMSTAPLRNLGIWDDITDEQLWQALQAFHETPLTAEEIELHDQVLRIYRPRGHDGLVVPPFSIATLENYWKVEHCFMRAFRVLHPPVEL